MNRRKFASTLLCSLAPESMRAPANRSPSSRRDFISCSLISASARAKKQHQQQPIDGRASERNKLRANYDVCIMNELTRRRRCSRLFHLAPFLGLQRARLPLDVTPTRTPAPDVDVAGDIRHLINTSRWGFRTDERTMKSINFLPFARSLAHSLRLAAAAAPSYLTDATTAAAAATATAAAAAAASHGS